MKQIFFHKSKGYLDLNIPHDNGAYYYCKEIYENIMPFIITKRPWVLLNVPGYCFDNAIVFIHNNKNPERYAWLSKYKNLILVCSQVKTLDFMVKLLPMHHTILLPLSIDTSYVSQFRVKRKSKHTAYYGRICKCPEHIFYDGAIDKIYGKDREENLRKVAKYKTVYAIGRCNLEAQCLKCKTITHTGEYEDTKFKLYDNKDVIPMLQKFINEIDGVI